MSANITDAQWVLKSDKRWVNNWVNNRKNDAERMSSLYCDALGILYTALGGMSSFEKIHDQDSDHQASQSHG